MPDSLPRARTRSPSLAGGAPPRSTPSRSPRIRALSTRLRGWSREGKNDPVRSSGMAGFDLPGGGGHRLEALAVAPVGALRRARRGAARRSRQRPRTPTGPVRPGPEQTPEDLVVSKIGVGKDFPDQRGHGRLVTGHRGCTPCESWSRNRAPTMPAALPGRRAPRRRGPRGNHHHTTRRTRGDRPLGCAQGQRRSVQVNSPDFDAGDDPLFRSGGRAGPHRQRSRRSGQQSPTRRARPAGSQLPAAGCRLPDYRLPLTGVGARSGR